MVFFHWAFDPATGSAEERNRQIAPAADRVLFALALALARSGDVTARRQGPWPGHMTIRREAPNAGPATPAIRVDLATGTVSLPFPLACAMTGEQRVPRAWREREVALSIERIRTGWGDETTFARAVARLVAGTA